MPCEIGRAIDAVALRNVSAERILSNLLEVVFPLISIERDQKLELRKCEKTQIDTKTEYLGSAHVRVWLMQSLFG